MIAEIKKNSKLTNIFEFGISGPVFQETLENASYLILPIILINCLTTHTMLHNTRHIRITYILTLSSVFNNINLLQQLKIRRDNYNLERVSKDTHQCAS